MIIKHEMRLEHETAGALRYQVVDNNDNFISDPKECHFGPKIYVRRAAFNGVPQRITMHLEVAED